MVILNYLHTIQNFNVCKCELWYLAFIYAALRSQLINKCCPAQVKLANMEESKQGPKTGTIFTMKEFHQKNGKY